MICEFDSTGGRSAIGSRQKYTMYFELGLYRKMREVWRNPGQYCSNITGTSSNSWP